MLRHAVVVVYVGRWQSEWSRISDVMTRSLDLGEWQGRWISMRSEMWEQLDATVSVTDSDELACVTRRSQWSYPAVLTLNRE